MEASAATTTIPAIIVFAVTGVLYLEPASAPTVPRGGLAAGKGIGSCGAYSISASTMPAVINGTCATISAFGFMTLVGP